MKKYFISNNSVDNLEYSFVINDTMCFVILFIILLSIIYVFREYLFNPYFVSFVLLIIFILIFRKIYTDENTNT